MNILFLTLLNCEDVEEKGIYTDLFRKFNKENHNVYVISPREKRSNLPTEFNIQRGINILKVSVGNITKTNLIEKGLSTLTLEQKYLFAIQKYFPSIKFDLVIYSTPPITFTKIVDYLKKKYDTRSYLLLKDIFPQNAVDLEMFSKKNPLYSFYRKKELNLYKISDVIGCMSPANVNYVRDHNPHLKNKLIEVCPNSIEIAQLDIPVEEKLSIRKKYDIPENKVVFLYGGNLGRPQGIDFLIECINKNKNSEEVFFVVVGSGTEYSKIEKFSLENDLSNFKLINQLSKDDYEKLSNSADVGLIFLDKRFTIPNFPSRLLSYMNASIPILAATDINTDVGKIAEEFKFGYWCQSGDYIEFEKKMKLLLNPDARVKMGLNGRRFLEENYSVDQTYHIIMKHFMEA